MKLGAIVLDSGNSEELSNFYQKLLGWTKYRQGPEWIILKSDSGEGLPLVFQEIDCYQRPVWPARADAQQQMTHLDFYTDDVPASVAHALACGAVLSPVQLEDSWQVLLDPAGHPFCILPTHPPAEA